MGFMENFRELKKNIDNEVFLMTCGIICFILPFATTVITANVDNMTINDYIFVFSGAAMGPTGLFAIANDNTLNMKINAVYLLYGAFTELKYFMMSKTGELPLNKLQTVLVVGFIIFYLINFLCLIIYILKYNGSLEERILRGELNNDPLLKQTIENDKVVNARLREEEQKRIERNKKSSKKTEKASDKKNE